MADHALLLSAFHAGEVNGRSQPQPAEKDLDIAVADNECAHALLLLATAATQVKVQDNKKRKVQTAGNNKTSCHGDHSSGSQNCCTTNKSSSILKRQLQSTPVRQRKSSSAAKVVGNRGAVKYEGDPEDYLQRLLIKRIKLDHNYAVEEQFKEMFETEDSKFGGDTASTSNRYTPDDRKDKVTSSRSMKKSTKTSPNQKVLHHPSPAKGSKTSRAALPESLSKTDPYEFQDEELDCDNLAIHSKLSQSDKVTRSRLSPDLYQPNDSKYKNFNLLLRCLTTEEPADEAVVHFSGRRRCNTIGSSTTLDLSGSEDGLISTDPNLIPDYNEHQCKSCFKVFSRKRYLTKHLSRMHPETETSEGDKDDMVSCPNCTHIISRKSFKRHSHVCNAHVQKSKKQLEMDLANCQFCGIRMRRHILVKHLAQEHCVENIKSATEALFRVEDDYSDTDSSTLSGSDNEDEKHSPSKDLMMCSLCNILVRRALLKEHIQQKHQPPVSNNNSCSETTTTTSPGGRTLVSCQLCGLELSRFALMKHLAEEHCTERKTGAETQNQEACNTDTPKPRSGCTHSMLQRFLSESSGDLDAMGPTDQCQSCISGLVKLASLTAVNRSPQPGSTSSPGGDLAVANGAAVCVVSKSTYSSASPVNRSTEALQDSCSNRTTV